MRHSSFDPEKYSLHDYVEAFGKQEKIDGFRKAGADSDDIILGIRYFQRKYGKRVEDIMDIATLLLHMNQYFPEEKEDRNFLLKVRKSIVASLEKNNETHKKSEKKSEMLANILNSTSQGSWFIDTDFHILHVNNALCELFEQEASEIRGKTLFDFFDQKGREIIMEKIFLMETTEHRDYVLDFTKKDGTIVPIKIHATTIRDDDKNVMGAVAFISDISEFREQEKRLLDQSITDALTGIYNRGFFDSELERCFDDFATGGLTRVSLALIDADRFKSINDSYGHNTGDKVLKQIGKMLASIDNPGISTYRYGGEEFALIGRGVSIEQMLAIVENFRQNIEDTRISLRGTNDTFRFTISAGVIHYDYLSGKKRTPKDITGSVDACLYKAKKSGRNCIKTPEDV